MDGGMADDPLPAPPAWTTYLLTPQCYHTLVSELNLLDGGCWLLLLSKVIGYTIILMTSVFVKLPQVIKILRARSGQGVSLLNQLFVIITTSAGVCYSVAKNFPFSTWGEGIALSLQNLTIVLLMLFYSDQSKAALVTVLVYFIAMVTLLSPFVPMVVHVALQLLSIPLTTTGKLSQIWLNIRNGGTGQLSSLSLLLQDLRSIGRLFTSITETGDPYRTAIFTVSSVLNTVLFAQIIYYHNKRSKPKSH